MPFGGVKGSGMGRFGGQAGIAEFTGLRWMTIQTKPRQYPFREIGQPRSSRQVRALRVRFPFSG